MNDPNTPVNQVKFVKLSQGQINFVTQLLSNVSVNGMQVPLQDLVQTLQDLNTEAFPPYATDVPMEEPDYNQQ